MKLRCYNPLFNDEAGALSHIILVLFASVILMTVISLDLIRQDSERSDLHEALDHTFLADASPSPIAEIEQVVTS